MHGVMKNISHLCSKTRSKVWDTEGWKKVVVCVVADGRKKCDPRVMDVLTTMGVYQTGVAKNMVDDKPVQAHLFEASLVFLSYVHCLIFYSVYDTSLSR